MLADFNLAVAKAIISLQFKCGTTMPDCQLPMLAFYDRLPHFSKSVSLSPLLQSIPPPTPYPSLPFTISLSIPSMVALRHSMSRKTYSSSAPCTSSSGREGDDTPPDGTVLTSVHIKGEGTSGNHQY